MRDLKIGRGMRLKLTISLIISLSLALAALSSCSKKSEEGKAEKKTAQVDLTPVYGDRLVEGSIGDASTLLPPLASDSASFGVASFIYNGLVKYDKDLKLTGDLAERWVVS